jgi:hypothetical protein
MRLTSKLLLAESDIPRQLWNHLTQMAKETDYIVDSNVKTPYAFSVGLYDPKNKNRCVSFVSIFRMRGEVVIDYLPEVEDLSESFLDASVAMGYRPRRNFDYSSNNGLGETFISEVLTNLSREEEDKQDEEDAADAEDEEAANAWEGEDETDF